MGFVGRNSRRHLGSVIEFRVSERCCSQRVIIDMIFNEVSMWFSLCVV